MQTEPVTGQPIATSVLGDSKKMPLINIVLALIVVGVALWLINNFIPMASSIKAILNVVVVVAVAIWVLQAVGLWGRVTSYKFMN
jgi:predicted membrane protein